MTSCESLEKKGIPPSQQNWLYFKGFSRRISSKYIQHYFHHSCTWFHFIQIVWAKSTPEFVGHCSSGLVPLATLQDGAGPRRYFPTLIHHDLRFSWLSLFCSQKAPKFFRGVFFVGMGSKYRRTGLPFKASPNRHHRSTAVSHCWISSGISFDSCGSSCLGSSYHACLRVRLFGEFRGVCMGRDGFWYIYVGEKKRFFPATTKVSIVKQEIFESLVKNCRCYRVGGWTHFCIFL